MDYGMDFIDPRALQSNHGDETKIANRFSHTELVKDGNE